jgi:long-chain acyl-CoA synthetase
MSNNNAIDDIPTLLATRGRSDGGAPALTYYRGRARINRMTYAQLLARVEATAGDLQRRGLRQGDRVALLAPNCPEVPVALLALWRLGAIAVPLNPALPVDWRHILSHSGARGCLAAPALIEQLPSYGFDFVRPLDEVNAAPPASERQVAGNDGQSATPAIILYTSGTTDRPKGVELSQGNLIANAKSMAQTFGLDGATQLAVLPLYHAHALGFGLMTALVTGGHLVFTDRFDPLTWPDIIVGESVRVTSVVPTLLPLLLKTRIRRERIPSLRSLLVSSAPLARELARDFEARTRIPLVQGWGLSEYTNFACCLDPEAGSDERHHLLYDEEVPSVGAALPGTEVTVRDEHGGEAAEGAPGELWVRGPSRMRAYFRDPQATERTLQGDWLRTGDQGYYRLHNRRPYFFISGRIKEIIIRGGEKYSPLALERLIFAELPELADKLVVLGFPHALQGEEIGAYVETPALGDAAATRILEGLERLPASARPKIILCGASPIPRTHTGKIQRRKLQALFANFKECSGPMRLVQAH